jgi:hypothetical protein
MSNMKTVAIWIAVFSVSVFVGCDGGEPSIPEVERVAAILTSTTWRVESVTIDGVNETASFPGLTLRFNASSYTTTNGAIVWPASGTWSFADDTAKKIDRSDGVVLTLEDVSTTALTVSFDWEKTTLGEGRAFSIAGKHEFTFVSQ